MDDEADLKLERVAKALQELARRQLSKTRYELEWSPQLPYSNAWIEQLCADDVGSCVYEVWERDDAEKRRVAHYIGETQHLGTRLREHADAAELNADLKQALGARRTLITFSYAPVTGAVARKSIERALWKLYQYQWNGKDGPTGARVDGQVTIVERFPEAYTIDFNGTRRALLGVESPVTLP